MSQHLLSPNHRGSRDISYFCSSAPAVICHQTYLRPNGPRSHPLRPCPPPPDRASEPPPSRVAHARLPAIPAGPPSAARWDRDAGGCGAGQGKQANVGLPDVGRPPGLSPGAGGAAGRSEGNGGEPLMEDKEPA